MTQLQRTFKADITKPKRRSQTYNWDLAVLVFGDPPEPKDKEEERIKARERYHAKKKKSEFDPGKGRLMQLNNSLSNHR